MVRYCALAAALVIVAVAQAQAAPQTDRCVVLVSIDGLAGFYLDDPRAEMPTLRRLAREGARASGMLCSFPTVTWPNHTTLVTGVTPAKHGVIGNNFFDRKAGRPVALILDPEYGKEQIVRAPTIYDVAHRAGLKTAGIIWPMTRGASTIDFNAPDMVTFEEWQQYGTRSWIDELAADGIPVDRASKWFKEPGGGVMRDWMYTRMFRQVLDKHQPNLLMIHIVEVDHVEHKYGPRTAEAYWSVSHADDRLRDLVEAVEASPWRGKTTFFVCSDHGFFTIRREIRPNVLLKQMKLVELDGSKITSRKAWCVAQGGGCAVYVLDEAHKPELVAKLKEALAQVEGVEKVLLSEQFDTIGQPTLAVDPHAADLWVTASENYSFGDTSTGDDVVTARESIGGTHGYLPEHDDLLGTCVLWGPTITPGTRLGKIANLDIAPTMAKVLGVELPNVEGKVLEVFVP
ncbi:MAG TPA: ectonucleotide pyrophosphatase/phosphodiesterase [Pirellulales bacterium]|nr:ectonucleotide pyrophosphatase/phosphodiesterase [Pirellulales bacterium]